MPDLLSDSAFSQDINDFCSDPQVEPEHRLDRSEVKRRRKTHGPNRLRSKKQKCIQTILVHQFNSIIVWLLALAMKTANSKDEDPHEGIALLGFVCLLDPLREGVSQAVQACRDATVRVVMLTGVHAETAGTIAENAGLGDGELCVIEGTEISDGEGDTAGEKRPCPPMPLPVSRPKPSWTWCRCSRRPVMLSR